MEIQDYIQNQLEKEGVYRAFPVSWTIEQSTKNDSQSVAIAFMFAIYSEWWGKDKGDGSDHGWSEEWAPGYFTVNRTWIVKKDGELNSGAINSLAKCGLWDGDWDKFEGPPPNVFVLVDVGSETWEGKLRFRANWINPDAAEPAERGGFKPTDPAMLTAMRARFQQKTKALAGGAPSGGAPAQPQPAAVVQPQPAVQAQAAQQQAQSPIAQQPVAAQPSIVPQQHPGAPVPQAAPQVAAPAASQPTHIAPQQTPAATPFPAPGGGAAGAIDPDKAPF